jgi:hypothetical protein
MSRLRFDPLSLTRRDCLRAGSLGLLGIGADEFARLQAQADERAGSQRERACIFVFLFGGPSHIDLWDMKPNAPEEIRGEFQPVSTKVPGIQICEHLPLLAQQIHRFCLLRSMTHRMNVHGPACSEVYSGRPYFGPPVTDQATPEDWPSIAALATRYVRQVGALPPAVVLPWYTQFVGQDRRIAGQTGGRMGRNWDPFLVEGDPSNKNFAVEGLTLPGDVSVERFQRRVALRSRLGTTGGRRVESAAIAKIVEQNYRTATSIVEHAGRSDAFAIEQEPEPVRRRYGPSKFGQSLLLSRRLVENGCRLITVNWDDETKFDKVSPHWDTHNKNFEKLKSGLCPVFDRAFSALLEDLDERGLLESTLVVALGEFGRTPNIGLITQNGMTQKTGRDHWPHAYTTLVAGGPVRGGQVYGATNSSGGYVADKPVGPADLSATIFQHLGINPKTEYYDPFQRMQRPLSEGRVLLDLG